MCRKILFSFLTVFAVSSAGQAKPGLKCSTEAGNGLYASASRLVEGKFQISRVFLRKGSAEPTLVRNSSGLLILENGKVRSLEIEKNYVDLVKFTRELGATDGLYEDETGSYRGNCTIQEVLKRWTCKITGSSNPVEEPKTLSFFIFDVSDVGTARRASMDQCATKAALANKFSFEEGMKHCRNLVRIYGMNCSSEEL